MQFIHLNLSGAGACKSYLPSLRGYWMMALLLLGACQSKTDSYSELLNNALSYHDPVGNWSTLKTRLYLSSVDKTSQKNNFEIELDNSTGYFAHISRQDGKEVMKAYRFNHAEPTSGEYILLEEEEIVEGIRMPKVRKWYWNKNNEYIGTDTLIRFEPLTSYRI